MTMVVRPFAARLASAKRRAGLSDRELSIWFGTPLSTFQSWLRYGRKPQWYRREDVDRRLAALERAIQRHDLPPPITVRQGERHDYIHAHAPG